MKPIKNLPDFDRPREKLVEKGPTALTDTELIAVLLGSGVKGKSIMQLATEILRFINQDEDKINVEALISIDGIGCARACQLVAAIEFSRRRLFKKRTIVHSAKNVISLVSHIADKKQEHLVCITLNGANEVINNRIITVGIVNSNQIHPREVFVDAISDRAIAVILVHNHPSGILKPSPEDIKATKQLIEAGKIIGIKVLDHIIVSKNDYISFKENDIM